MGTKRRTTGGEKEILEAALASAIRENEELAMQHHLAELDSGAMNRIRTQNAVREAHNDGTLMRFIEQAVRQKNQLDEDYRDALTFAGRLSMKEETPVRQMIYAMLADGLKIEDIPEFMMREAFVDDPMPLKQAASFSASLNMRLRKGQLAGDLPEWRLDDKQTGIRFADALGIKRPHTHDRTYTIDTLPVEAMTVVKPVEGAGARGVYLINSQNDIIDLKRAKALTSSDALITSMKQDLADKSVAQDDWMVEEQILEDKTNQLPASDVKFYCFYGKVGLVLEIKRYPELKYCWWDTQGNRVVTGKYDEVPFNGKGVSQEEMDMAAAISAEIPAPFIRIDFLRSEAGLVLGNSHRSPVTTTASVKRRTGGWATASLKRKPVLSRICLSRRDSVHIRN
ncbi:ATP-grasp fold amidoligase family protein [Salinicoccus sp. CNSTN-B1]